jgi:hypothetical protein
MEIEQGVSGSYKKWAGGLKEEEEKARGPSPMVEHLQIYNLTLKT